MVKYGHEIYIVPGAEEQIVDDQEIGFGKEFGHVFSPFQLRGLEEILEKAVGFAVDDFVS